MSKFIIASLAVLCTLFISCSKEEIEVENFEHHQVESRSVSQITVTYVDGSGNTQNITCKEADLNYVSSSSVELEVTYSDGTTQTTTGDNITILPTSPRLDVTTDSKSFLSTELYVYACGADLCYTKNGGNTIGKSSYFIVEDEPGGY